MEYSEAFLREGTLDPSGMHPSKALWRRRSMERHPDAVRRLPARTRHLDPRRVAIRAETHVATFPFVARTAALSAGEEAVEQGEGKASRLK